jgi:hypothetical protein
MMAASMSLGGTFSPFDSTMISFSRPVSVRKPSSSMAPKSPVCSQPSAKARSLSSGRFQ